MRHDFSILNGICIFLIILLLKLVCSGCSETFRCIQLFVIYKNVEVNILVCESLYTSMIIFLG